MRNKFFLLVITLVWALSALAQSSDQNKYWFYRYRLRHKFLKAGIQEYPCVDPNSNNLVTGYSIPAGIIEYPTNKLAWGDGTVDLGWYIGILATEWKLLKDNTEKK